MMVVVMVVVFFVGGTNHEDVYAIVQRANDASDDRGQLRGFVHLGGD